MFKTIRGKLTSIVIIIVAIAMIALAVTSLMMFGYNMDASAREGLQSKANQRAAEVNNWISGEKTMAEGINTAIVASGTPNIDQIQKLLAASGQGRDQLLNCYFGSEKKDFVQMDANAEPPEGYDPTERGWYKAAKEAGTTIVTDPYMDVLIGGMCVTVATPVMIDGALYGVIGVDYTLDTLTQITEAANEDREYGFLVDASGNYIIHPNSEWMPGEEITTAVSTAMPDISGIISSPASEVIATGDYEGGVTYFASGDISSCGWVFGVAARQSKVTGILNVLLIISILITAAAITLVIILMLILVKKSLQPLEEMEQFVVDNLIDDESVLKGKTEGSKIRFLIDVLKERFLATIDKTRGESTAIEDMMSDAHSKIGDMNEEITTISAAMEETGASVDTQTESIKNISMTCSEVSVAVDKLANEAQEMAEKAHDIQVHVEEMVPDIIRNKNSALEITHESREKLEAAIEGAKIINEIVGVSQSIQAIANQTNLLALNASIEAARAGETGKGFAVVASEIGTLAQNTSDEIDKVNDLTSKVLNSVDTLSNESNNILEFLDTKVVVDYEGLEALANDYDRDASYYAEISADLGAAAEELTASVDTINSIVGTIEESQHEVNRAVQEVNETLQEIAMNSDTISGETDEVLKSIRNLKNVVDGN
ncbi:MAG: methyl-accepting chemotaxis protein [Eubacterium sp.]|nr:methyl-accepting chemotaxis protein [Eubacterium sp.]